MIIALAMTDKAAAIALCVVVTVVAVSFSALSGFILASVALLMKATICVLVVSMSVGVCPENMNKGAAAAVSVAMLMAGFSASSDGLLTSVATTLFKLAFFFFMAFLLSWLIGIAIVFYALRSWLNRARGRRQ